MAKTAKERKRARKMSRQGEVFSLAQEFSPNLKSYLQFIRDNEKLVLGLFIGLILLASVIFASRDYRIHRSKTANADYQLRVLKDEARTAYLEREQQRESERREESWAERVKKREALDPPPPADNTTSVTFGADTSWRFTYELARDRYVNGRRDEALVLLKPLEARFAKRVGVPKPFNNIYSFLAMIHYKDEKFELAERDFLRAVKLRAYDDEFKLLFGEFLLRAKQPLEAAGWLEHVANHPEHGARARKLLGEIDALLIAPTAAGDGATSRTSATSQTLGADAVTTDSVLRMFEPAPKKN